MHTGETLAKLTDNSIAVGVEFVVVFTYKYVTRAWEAEVPTDFEGYFFWDISQVVAVMGEHLDGVSIVGVGWFGFEGAFTLTDIVVDVFSVGNAGNRELYDVKLVMVFRPYTDVVAFVLDAEVFQLLDFGVWIVLRFNF